MYRLPSPGLLDSAGRRRLPSHRPWRACLPRKNALIPPPWSWWPWLMAQNSASPMSMPSAWALARKASVSPVSKKELVSAGFNPKTQAVFAFEAVQGAVVNKAGYLHSISFLIRCMAFAAMHIAEAERRLCSRPALQSLMQFGRSAPRAVLLKTGLTGPRRG